MDISAVSTLANSNNTSAVADKLKNNVKNLSSDSTEDELKSTLKDFESYFVEQVIKEMKKCSADRCKGKSGKLPKREIPFHGRTSDKYHFCRYLMRRALRLFRRAALCAETVRTTDMIRIKRKASV